MIFIMSDSVKSSTQTQKMELLLKLKLYISLKYKHYLALRWFVNLCWKQLFEICPNFSYRSFHYPK